MSKVKYIIAFISSIALLPLFLPAQNYENNHLFTIVRSRDADVIEYSLNIDEDGQLDQDDPIFINWVRHSKSGKLESLTWIQNKYAYGLVWDKNNSGLIQNFAFACAKHKRFTLEKINGKYGVYMKLENKKVQVSEIHVQFGGGTFMLPTINEVMLMGLIPNNNSLISEVLYPE